MSTTRHDGSTSFATVRAAKAPVGLNVPGSNEAIFVEKSGLFSGLGSDIVLKLIALLILGVVAIGIFLGLLVLANAQLGDIPAESRSFQRESARSVAEDIKSFAIFGLGVGGGLTVIAMLGIAWRRFRASD